MKLIKKLGLHRVNWHKKINPIPVIIGSLAYLVVLLGSVSCLYYYKCVIPAQSSREISLYYQQFEGRLPAEMKAKIKKFDPEEKIAFPKEEMPQESGE